MKYFCVEMSDFYSIKLIQLRLQQVIVCTCGYVLSFILLNWKVKRISNSGIIKCINFIKVFLSYLISALYYTEQNFCHIGCHNIVPKFYHIFCLFYACS